MAYKDIPQSDQRSQSHQPNDFLQDIISRKEFSVYVTPKYDEDKYLSSKDSAFIALQSNTRGDHENDQSNTTPLILPGLRLHGAQLFQKSFLSPDTPYPRLLLNWQTGAGKSIAAVSLALEYIKTFRYGVAFSSDQSGNMSSYTTDTMPSIIVLGFTVKATILAEMMVHPEFGYVTPNDVEEIKKLKREISINFSQDAVKKYGNMIGLIKRKITDRTRGGLFKFYGYKEFANRLFSITSLGLSKDFSVQSLYDRNTREGNDNDEFNIRLKEAVIKGYINIDESLVNEIRGGFLICDEIHNVYNIVKKNNYGVAIQYVLDVLGDEAPRVLFMTATPMKGSASESVDILNLLIPKEYLPEGRHLTKSDFFTTSHAAPTPTNTGIPADTATPIVDGDIDDDEEEIQTTVSKLIPGALEKISMLSLGRISFLFDTDVSVYPKRIFMGDNYPDIPYLKFVLCPISDLHRKTLVHDFGKVGITSLSAESYSLYDLVFPNPASEDHGLYMSTTLSTTISDAPVDWLREKGVEIKRGKELGVISGTVGLAGNFLSSKNIGKYSGKYAKMLELILDILSNEKGKIMIYHHRVRMSGVLIIQEILRANGIIGEHDIATDNTLCTHCGKILREHSGIGAHQYVPARFIAIHSDADKSQTDKSIVRFNAPENLYGDYYRIIIGSRIIRESYNFKAIRFQIICSLPVDIPTMIQIFGRVVRRGSHTDLQENERDVKIWTLVSYAKETDSNGNVELFPEIKKYHDKMAEFKIIQEIERAMRTTAVDMYANYRHILASYPMLETTPTLESLPLKPIYTDKDIGKITDVTFNAYGHGDREVSTLVTIISAIFTIRPVWKYEDLWKCVIEKPIKSVIYNTSMITEKNFVLAIRKMITDNAITYADPYYIKSLPMPGDNISQLGRNKKPLEIIDYKGSDIVNTNLPDYGMYMSSAQINHSSMIDAKLRIVDYLRAIKNKGAVNKQIAQTLSEYDNIDLSLIDERLEFHDSMLSNLVDGSIKNRELLDMYRSFGIALIASNIGDKTMIRGNGEGVVGFVSLNVIKMFDNVKSEWYSLPKSVIKTKSQKENNIIVGYVEKDFKIRPPIHLIMTTGEKHDIRTLSRGAMCHTRQRGDLIAKLELLVDEAEENGIDIGKIDYKTVTDICKHIKTVLLTLEKDSRKHNKGVRWVYLYNDALPSIK